MNTTILANAAMDFGERLGYAGRMLVIGMLIVFLALATLWGALSLFRLAITAFGKKEKKTPLPTALPKQEPPTPAPADDGALIAAITAAISVVLAEENGGACPAFRVVSFKRSRQ